MEEKQYWSMDELLSLIDKVQETEIQWCELTESEEPKMIMPDESLPEEEKTKIYVEMAADRVKTMMSKANEKNPEGMVINLDDWNKLPTNLRYNIQNKVLGSGTNFQNG